jgi:hypothetical protein
MCTLCRDEGERMPAPRSTAEQLRTAHKVYREAIGGIRRAEVPFLVGGAYAFARYTGIERFTKDFDIFIRPEDLDRLLAVLGDAGFRTERTFKHWLAKAYGGEDFLDLIYSSGNGVAQVDAEWFRHGVEGEVLGHHVRLVAPEEMIWSKSFIMERERYDGGDVAHLLRATADELDWPRLLSRFGAYWRVLYSHLVLFGFIYPSERARVPLWVMEQLTGRLASELRTAAPADPVCQGTILSREQFLPDVERWGYIDARVSPRGRMTPQETAAWTEAIGQDD